MPFKTLSTPFPPAAEAPRPVGDSRSVPVGWRRAGAWRPDEGVGDVFVDGASWSVGTIVTGPYWTYHWTCSIPSSSACLRWILRFSHGETCQGESRERGEKSSARLWPQIWNSSLVRMRGGVSNSLSIHILFSKRVIGAGNLDRTR